MTRRHPIIGSGCVLWGYTLTKIGNGIMHDWPQEGLIHSHAIMAYGFAFGFLVLGIFLIAGPRHAD